MSIRKKEIVFILVSILFTFVINFLIYNLRVIAEYLFQTNFEPFTQPDIARFISYFLFAYFINKKNKSNYKKLWIIFLPVLVVDATTLIVGRELIPLRFPFATLYPLLGIYCGIFLRVNRTIFIGIFICSIIFMILSYFYFIPAILKKMHEKYNVIEAKSNNLMNSTFIGVNNIPVVLFDTLKSNPALIEFYFVGCQPCEQKFDYLKIIYDEFSNRKFNIILVCDGKASSYKQFTNHWKKNKYRRIIFLYDLNNSINKYQIEGYPTELLTNGRFIIKKEKGFGTAIANDWLRKEKILIDQILNDAK